MNECKRRIQIFGGILGLVAGLFVAPLAAHHSFAAEFDVKKPIKVSGKLTQMRWSNPHAWLYLDVAGPDGKVVKWSFELNATNGLVRSGWKKEDLPAGIVLVVEGYQARDGQPVGNAVSITLSDGRKLQAGSSVTTVQP